MLLQISRNFPFRDFINGFFKQGYSPTPSSSLRKCEEDIERGAIQNPNLTEYQVDPQPLTTLPHNVSEYLANFLNVRLPSQRIAHPGLTIFLLIVIWYTAIGLGSATRTRQREFLSPPEHPNINIVVNGAPARLDGATVTITILTERPPDTQPATHAR